MSKRFIFQQQYGERKKAKLDITVSDHNFPLSQNEGKDTEQGNSWGDENDDEFLLLASQACEEALSDQNTSALPDYSMCMQPSSTSTQVHEPLPSTSKTGFTFKKPNSSPLNTVSTKLKDKCERISSPLHGMSKVCKSNDVNVSDDIIFNDKFKGQGSDYVYRQLLQMQEENAKLKLENSKLLEKCVTKEGETAILRTQLKSCQMAVDNVRLEKIKAQEKAKMEWSDKLTASNNQLQDLRNQLDFKHLEIISIKEKCKMLESNKVKLTQVMVAGNDVSMSQKYNSSYYANDIQSRRVKTVTNAVQTDDKAHFIKLNLPNKKESSQLNKILPHIMEPTSDQCSILDYNEKLKQPSDMLNKCRIFSTFHRLPSTPIVCRDSNKKKIDLTSVYEDLTCIAAGGDSMDKYLNIFKLAKELLKDVQYELESVSQRMTTAFQKEMNERYFDVTSNLLVVNRQDLLSGRYLYKEEQSILARRITAVLFYILEDSRIRNTFDKVLEYNTKQNDRLLDGLVEVISKICVLLDGTSCAVLYSGLLLAITLFMETLPIAKFSNIFSQIIRNIIVSRPMPFVSSDILRLLTRMYSKEMLKDLCLKDAQSNLKTDYDQGVLLFKRDTCTLQVLLKQTEAALRCTERQGLNMAALDYAKDLLTLYNNYSTGKAKCDCQLVLMQVIVYSLRICVNMLRSDKLTEQFSDKSQYNQTDILSVCRSGVQVMYQSIMRDMEFISQLGYNEGHLLQFCEVMNDYQHPEIYGNMLSEMTNMFNSAVEDQPQSYHRQAWLDSFQTFSIAD